MTVKSYFENHKTIIENELLRAQGQVLIAVAWINFKEYFSIFKKVLSNSSKLKIVCSDNWQNRSHQTEINELIKLGAEISLLKMPRITNHMHHKFSIIDNKTILNGSFNWSPNATSSFENILVIKDYPTEITKFVSEFEKLFTIKSESIKELQKNKKCIKRTCKGKLFNILVFSENSKYYEVYGDIIEICNVCDHCKTIKDAISNNEMEFMIIAYNEASDDFEAELIDRKINRALNRYLTEDTLIHAIGKISSGLKYPNDDFIETNIIWKNKFVGDKLPNKFDTNFGIVYDS